MCSLSAQIYKGGVGDGYAENRYLGVLTGQTVQPIYQGGSGDGYACSFREGLLQGPNISTLFQGGVGNGYAEDRLLESLSGISVAGMFKGGNDDGYDQFWVRGSLLLTPVFPVELLSFEAFAVDESVQLQWATASELNHAYFTIERSINAQDFEYVKEVPGVGNSQQVRRYEALDEQPYSGTSFYRLKSVDIDGGYEYSQTVEVNIQTTSESELILYPNPNPGNVLFVKWQSKTIHNQIEIVITDLQGRQIYFRQLKNPSARLETEIPLNQSFNKGTYILTISHAFHQQSQLFTIH